MIKLFAKNTLIFSNKTLPNKVTCHFWNWHDYQLVRRSKDVINNYLKDKPVSVTIASPNAEDLWVNGYSADSKCQMGVRVKRGGDTPLLRKVYKAVEIISKQIKHYRVDSVNPDIRNRTVIR